MKYFLIQFAEKLLNPGDGTGGTVNVPVLPGGDQVLQNGLNITYFAAAIIAVITIVIAGIMYSVSSGDQTKIGHAKNMIIFAVAGLIVILSAAAITNLVIGGLS